jgi:hypothetical protein
MQTLVAPMLLETSIVLKPPLASQLDPSAWISICQNQDGMVHLIIFHAFQHFKENHRGVGNLARTQGFI